MFQAIAIIGAIWGKGRRDRNPHPYPKRDRTLGIEKVRSRGSPGICRGGREPFNFDVCDKFSTRARPDSKWRCVLGDRAFDQGLAQIGRERCDRTLGDYHF
ncbi:hypothetical protein [Coleofasciculus chthonoplastes]|uniref:hypothetical protein n=1 Tax=Coleofasciculus chthonoplastes TaxID=64178 RepID=UPI0040629BF5